MRINNSFGGLQANGFGEDGMPWDGWQPAVAEQHSGVSVGSWSAWTTNSAETSSVSSWNAGTSGANEALPVAPTSQPDYSAYDGRSDVGNLYSESGAMAPALPVEFNEKACGVDARWLPPRQPERDSAPVVAPTFGYSESGEPIPLVTVVRDLVVTDERARIPERGAFPGDGPRRTLGHAPGRLGEQGPRLQAGERPATGPSTMVTEPPRDRSAEQWDSVRQLWTEHQHDPYRLMQQMIEREVDAKDIAFATGQSMQAMDDYFITRGAPQGFAGITPVDRDAVQADYLRAIDACVQSGQGVGWTGEGSATSFDIAVFNAWYASQDTPLVRDFLRLHGEDFSRSGASVSLGAWHNIGDSSELVYTHSQLSWAGTEAHNTQTRIDEYLAFRALRPPASNLFMIDASLHGEETQLLLSHYAHLVGPMPDSRRTEQLRAIYGDARAELIHRVTQANLLGVNGTFNSALQQAGDSPPEVRSAQGLPITTIGVVDLSGLTPLPPGWRWFAHTSPVQIDGAVDGVTYKAEFDPAAYATWYAAQDTVDSRLFALTYGDSFTAVRSSNRGGGPNRGDLPELWMNSARTQGGWGISATRGLHDDGDLAVLDLSHPRNLRDDRVITYNPLLGLVTPAQNIYVNDHAWDVAGQLAMAALIAFAGFVSGGAMSAALGPALAGTTAGVMATAGVVGATTSAFGQLVATGEVGDWDAVLKGAVVGAVTAGFAQATGLNEVGLLTDDLTQQVSVINGHTVVADWGARLAANGLTSAFNGLVADLTGGDFTQSFVSSFLGKVGSDVGNTLSLQVNSLPDLTPAQRAMGRVVAQSVGRAFSLLGNPGDPDYSTAIAFLSGLGLDIQHELDSPTTHPVTGTSDPSPGEHATGHADEPVVSGSHPAQGNAASGGYGDVDGIEFQSLLAPGASGSSQGQTVAGGSDPAASLGSGDDVTDVGADVAAPVHEPIPTVSFHPSDNYGGANGDQSVEGHSVRVTSETASISQLLGTSNPQAIGNFMRANNLRTSEIFEGQTYFIPDSRTAYGDQVPLGQAALNRDNARIAQLNAARARAEAEAAARAPVQMIPNPLGFFEYVPADSPMGRLLLLAQTDPALASQIMEYRDSIRREFIGQRDAEAALLASPRAQSTLRSDYPPPSTPLGASMSAWDGVVRESAIARMDREARAPGANRIENQVGPVIQPFVLSLVPGGNFLSAVMGARQVGEGWAQIENGDPLMGATNMGLGSLQVVGSVAAMSRPPVAGTSGPVRDSVFVPSARNPVYDFELLPNGHVVPVRANGSVPLTPAQLTSTGIESTRPVVPAPRPWGMGPGAQSRTPAPVTLGDLTPSEVTAIQNGANTLNGPIYVTGSAANGARRGVGTDLPLAEFGQPQTGTRSDIDYAVHPSLDQAANRLDLPDADPSFGVRGVDYLNLDRGPVLVFDPNFPPSVLDGQGRYYLLNPQASGGGGTVSVDARTPAATPVTPTQQVLHVGTNEVLVVQDAAGNNFVGKFPTQDVPAAEQANALARERQAVIDLMPYGGPAYLGDVVMPDGRVGVAMQHIAGGVSLDDAPTFPTTQAHVDAMSNLFDRFAANNVRPDDHHASNYLLTPEGGVVPIDSVLVPGAISAEMRAEMLNRLQERRAGRFWDPGVPQTRSSAEFRDLINRIRAAEEAEDAAGTTAQQPSTPSGP